MADPDPFLGNVALLTKLDEIPCKANWQAARHRYVLETYGEAGIDDVAGRLEPEVRRAFLSPPLTMAWSNVATVVRIDRAIFEGPMNRELRRMHRFGAEIAKYDVPSIYRAFFRLGTPSFILGKIPLVWSQYFRRGTIKTIIGKGEAELTLEDLCMPLYLCAQGIPGWFDATLELVGARGRTVEQSKCMHAGDPQCTWRATWRS